MFGRYAGRELYIDNAVFLSERTTGHRNRAIAHLMLNFGMVSDQDRRVAGALFPAMLDPGQRHDLAVMGATLANAGVNPLTKNRAIERHHVKDMLSIMLSCGMYDYAGEWAYRVGLPAKSGVGGGICAVVPGRCGIGIFSPLLDAKRQQRSRDQSVRRTLLAVRTARLRIGLRGPAVRRGISAAEALGPCARCRESTLLNA